MKTPVQSRMAPDRRPHSAFRTPHSRTGFTLLEVLVATGVLALMVTILFSLFAEGSNAWRTGERTAEVNQGVRMAMGMIVRDASLAVIETNGMSGQQGLSVSIQKNSSGDQPATDPSPCGVYGELSFVAPTELGNEPGNNSATTNGYRGLCGVRYYVARAPTIGSKQPVLGNLVRTVHLANNKSTASFVLYNTAWWAMPNPTGMTNSAVLAENVLSFRVHAAQVDSSHPQGIRPANAQMFKDMNSDPGVPLISYNNYANYPGVYVGLCVVDSRLASRINQIGLSEMTKTPQFHAYTNWTLIRFENFKP